MREDQNTEKVRIPFIVRGDSDTLLAFHSGALFEADKQSGVSVETTAKRFVARYLGLAAAKALGPVGCIENIHGYALYPSAGQPFEIPNVHRLLIGVHDIEEYLESETPHKDPTNIAFVKEALRRSKALR